MKLASLATCLIAWAMLLAVCVLPAQAFASSEPSSAVTPCATNSGAAADTEPCLGPEHTPVSLLLHKPLQDPPMKMFFTRSDDGGGHLCVPLRGSGVTFQAEAPQALCRGNAPHTYWVGFTDSAGRDYPRQGKFTMTGCK
jgi:hypothetical protein